VTLNDHPNVFQSLPDDDPSVNPATATGRRVAEEALMKPKSTFAGGQDCLMIARAAKSAATRKK
jgi:hypothetical protein